MNSFQSMASVFTSAGTGASKASFLLLIFSPIFNDFIRYLSQWIQCFLLKALYYLKPRSPKLTLVIEEKNSIGLNEVYEDAEVYLSTKINPDAHRLKVIKTPKDRSLSIRFENGEKIKDLFQGIELLWMFLSVDLKKSKNSDSDSDSDSDSNASNNLLKEKRKFELTFERKYRDLVLYYYLPFVASRAKAIKDEDKVIKIWTLTTEFEYDDETWRSINLKHPSTFDTLAIEPEQKKSIIADLDGFVQRKDFYNKVGKNWKRGYLLYGPPGTGKSSLIAAMANYLKFDVYDLQLGNVRDDFSLRKLLLATMNRSIIVIEDIDCSVELRDGQYFEKGSKKRDKKVTLSGLLNFIDGLWSSCGDERIIVLTTNHKEKLDPALLRPGRMDVHIHMSYCTPGGFRILASNYLEIKEHKHFKKIEDLIREVEVSPAQVAGQLMKPGELDVILEGLIELLEEKKKENEEKEAVKLKKPTMAKKLQKMTSLLKKKKEEKEDGNDDEDGND